MKDPRKLSAVILAGLIASASVAAAAEETQAKEPAKKQDKPSIKSLDYYVYLGFLEDKEQIDKMFKLFLERRPAFGKLQDGRPGFYAGQAEPVPANLGNKKGWMIKIKCSNFAEAEDFFALSKGFFYAPDVQRKYGKKGGVWMFYGDSYVPVKHELDLSNLDEPVPRLPEDKRSAKPGLPQPWLQNRQLVEPRLPNTQFGVQVGAFQNKENAISRLVDARKYIDPRFDVKDIDGWHKVRLTGLSAEEASAIMYKAMAILGSKEAFIIFDDTNKKDLMAYALSFGQRSR